MAGSTVLFLVTSFGYPSVALPLIGNELVFDAHRLARILIDFLSPFQMAELAHAIPAVDMINATSRLQLEAAEVRASKPNWGSYLRSSMIPQEDYNFISAYENAKNKKERDGVLAANDANGQAARTIVNLITNVAKDQNVRYVLTLLDDMLQEDKSRVEIFHNAARKQKRTAWSWFLGILQRQDNFIVNQMSSIIAKLACFGKTLMEGSELNYYFSFLKDQLKSAATNEYMNTTARCLQMMLRIDQYRHAFVEAEGIQSIVAALNGKANFQLQYQLLFALWCLTFSPDIARRAPALGVIQALGDILSESSKEKVIRIIMATFSNILKKVDEREIKKEAALQMVQCKTLKTLELMDAKKYDDSELEEDIEFLSEQLHLSVQDLSSFDEYCSEVRSGRLQWSPVHKSDKFWRENAPRFNEKNFELIKILIRLLETSQDPLILCVAAHDVGEYVRHYPRGKTVVEQYQGKQAVMKLLTAEDPNVRYHALLAVQKLMAHSERMLKRFLQRVVATMTKVADAAENKSEAVLHDVQSGKIEKHTSEAAKARIKRAKYAMLLAYQGKEYFGMQIQKEHPTIEGQLINAMNKLGWITDEMKEQPSLFHFQRAARTDRAVSAVRQICGMELPRSDDYPVTGANELNALLPKDIRVIAMRRATNAFHPQKMCCARTYSYTLPTFAFAKPTELTNAAFRISKETIDEINSVLSIYKGTHNFFNYTSRREFDDRSCHRYILSFECGEPFLFHDDIRNEDVEFIQLTVKGQSFILHQIRKMVGMLITVIRELQYKSYIQRTFESERVDVPKAPGLGLLLERVHYDLYDRKHAKTHEPLTDWGSAVEARIEEVKFELITKEILLSELRHQSMLQWLADLVNHDFSADPESEELPKQSFLTMAVAKAAEAREEAAKEANSEDLTESEKKVQKEENGAETVEVPAAEKHYQRLRRCLQVRHE
ncbi:tRNA pseudouridine synthase A [Cooperia oncophora]